jgi:COMPASS component SWD3
MASGGLDRTVRIWKESIPPPQHAREELDGQTPMSNGFDADVLPPNSFAEA